MKVFLLVFLLFAAPAIAADVGSPPPDARAAMLKAVLAIEHARAAVQVAVDAQEAAAQGAKAGAVAPAAAAPAPVTAAPVVPPEPVATTPSATPPIMTTPVVAVPTPAVTTADWVAIFGIVLPLFGKLAVDARTWLLLRKHTALANIVGMAQRQAASAARALANIPPGSDPKIYERELIASATDTVLAEMNGSAATIKARAPQVATVVQGELDKLIVAPVAIVPAAPPAKPVINIVQAPPGDATGPHAVPTWTS